MISPAAALGEVSAWVGQLEAAGTLGHGQATSLQAKLQAATFKLGFSPATLALVHLRDVLIELDQLVRLGRLSAADAAPLTDMVTRAYQSITFQAGT